MAEKIEVAAGVIFEKGKLLVTKRLQGTHLENFWEFPGGKREPDESFEQCLVRELLEEIGVQATVGSLLHDVNHRYPSKSVYIRFYHCSAMQGEPKALECQEIRWVDQSGLKNLMFPKADIDLIRQLEKRSDLWEDSGGNQ